MAKPTSTTRLPARRTGVMRGARWIIQLLCAWGEILSTGGSARSAMRRMKRRRRFDPAVGPVVDRRQLELDFSFDTDCRKACSSFV